MTKDAKKFLLIVACGLVLIACVSLIGSLVGFGGAVVGEDKVCEVEFLLNLNNNLKALCFVRGPFL